MSRNSKSARVHAIARQFSAIRKAGGSGPAKTQKKTNKSNTFWALKKADVQVEAVDKKKKRNRTEETTGE